MLCKNWNQKELDFLERNYKRMETRELALIMKRSAGAIYRKARELELTSGTPGRPKKSVFEQCRKNSRIYKFDQLLRSAAATGGDQ